VDQVTIFEGHHVLLHTS